MRTAELTHDPRQNSLLAALQEPVWERWLPHLEPIDMPLGTAIYESGGALHHVYFPTSPIASLLYVMEDGASAEISVVGNEGLVGVSLFMGDKPHPAVRLFRVPAGDFASEQIC